MSGTPKRWSDFERYLVADHLQGRAITVKIRAVELIETHPRQGVSEQTPALYFTNPQSGAAMKRPLLLSTVNQRTLRNLFGDDVEKCIGQLITLAAETVRVGGKDKTPIRISAARAPTPAPTSTNGQGAAIANQTTG